MIVKAFGRPEQLTLESTDEAPQPGPGQVLVEVEAAGVNYIDVMHRKGSRRSLSHTRRDSRVSGG